MNYRSTDEMIRFIWEKTNVWEVFIKHYKLPLLIFVTLQIFSGVFFILACLLNDIFIFPCLFFVIATAITFYLFRKKILKTYDGQSYFRIVSDLQMKRTNEVLASLEIQTNEKVKALFEVVGFRFSQIMSPIPQLGFFGSIFIAGFSGIFGIALSQSDLRGVHLIEVCILFLVTCARIIGIYIGLRSIFFLFGWIVQPEKEMARALLIRLNDILCHQINENSEDRLCVHTCCSKRRQKIPYFE